MEVLALIESSNHVCYRYRIEVYAAALARRGVDVTLLEGHGWLLPRQLNPRAGELLADHATRKGIKLRSKARTQSVIGNERVQGVLLDDNTVIEADLVVLATSGLTERDFEAIRVFRELRPEVYVMLTFPTGGRGGRTFSFLSLPHRPDQNIHFFRFVTF